MGILNAFKYDEKGCNPVSRAPQASNKAEMSNLLPELFKVHRVLPLVKRGCHSQLVIFQLEGLLL